MSDQPCQVAILAPENYNLPTLYTKMLEVYQKDGGNNSEFEVTAIGSAAEMQQFIGMYPYGIILFSMVDRAQIPEVVTLIKNIAPLLKKNTVKIAGFDTIRHPRVSKFFKKMGIAEVFEANLNQRALEFKIRLWHKAVKVSHEKLGGDQELSLSEQGASSSSGKEQKKRVQTQVQYVDPVHVSSDCWILGHKNNVRNIRGVWFIEMIGPGPAAGFWEEVENVAEDSEDCWKWVPLREELYPIIMDPGFWVYQGRKPEFDWETNKWKFVANKPSLVFYDEEPVCYRFQMQDEYFVFAENSDRAKDKLDVIKESLDPKFEFNRENYEAGDHELDVDGNPINTNMEGEGSTDQLGDENRTGEVGVDNLGNQNMVHDSEKELDLGLEDSEDEIIQKKKKSQEEEAKRSGSLDPLVSAEQKERERGEYDEERPQWREGGMMGGPTPDEDEFDPSELDSLREEFDHEAKEESELGIAAEAEKRQQEAEKKKKAREEEEAEKRRVQLDLEQKKMDQARKEEEDAQRARELAEQAMKESPLEDMMGGAINNALDEAVDDFDHQEENEKQREKDLEESKQRALNQPTLGKKEPSDPREKKKRREQEKAAGGKPRSPLSNEDDGNMQSDFGAGDRLGNQMSGQSMGEGSGSKGDMDGEGSEASKLDKYLRGGEAKKDEVSSEYGKWGGPSGQKEGPKKGQGPLYGQIGPQDDPKSRDLAEKKKTQVNLNNANASPLMKDMASLEDDLDARVEKEVPEDKSIDVGGQNINLNDVSVTLTLKTKSKGSSIFDMSCEAFLSDIMETHIVLENPAQKCHKGQNVLISADCKYGPRNYFFDFVGVVEAVDSLEDGDLYLVKLTKFDEDDLETLMHIFLERQTNIAKFFKAAKGY